MKNRCHFESPTYKSIFKSVPTIFVECKATAVLSLPRDNFPLKSSRPTHVLQAIFLTCNDFGYFMLPWWICLWKPRRNSDDDHAGVMHYMRVYKMVGVTKTTMKKNALPTNFSKAQPTKIVWSHLNPDTYISFFWTLINASVYQKIVVLPSSSTLERCRPCHVSLFVRPSSGKNRMFVVKPSWKKKESN